MPNIVCETKFGLLKYFLWSSVLSTNLAFPLFLNFSTVQSQTLLFISLKNIFKAINSIRFSALK